MTRETGGLLDLAISENVVPKVFFSNTSYEYWGRAAALISVDPEGKQDVPISDNVRIYHFTGLQHFSGPSPPRKGAALVIFLVGVVCGVVRAVTRSVGASFLVHAGFNGTQMLIAVVMTHGFKHMPKAFEFCLR